MPNKPQPEPPGRTAPRDLQKVMAALTSPVRREILTLIWEAELPAGEIAAAFAVTKPTISQHLAVLRDAGLVTVRAAGTSRRYRARQEALRGLRAALSSPAKWENADDAPERQLSNARTGYAVVVRAEAGLDQASAFAAFTDPELYSRWLGVPVTIDGGRFSCTMEWGTRVRGRYEVICPPDLIAMRWDFEDDNVPVPGGEMDAYLRIYPLGDGARVEVHQFAESSSQASFMELAWSMVLGRFSAWNGAGSDTEKPRAPRPKRRG